MIDAKTAIIVITIICAAVAVIMFIKYDKTHTKIPKQQPSPSVVYVPAPSAPQIVKVPYYVPDFNNYGWRDRTWGDRTWRDRDIIINTNANSNILHHLDTTHGHH